MPFPVYNGTSWANSEVRVYNGTSWIYVGSAYVFNANNVWEKVYDAAEFTRPPGTYVLARKTGQLTINSTQPVVWSYVISSGTVTSSVANNATSNTITFTTADTVHITNMKATLSNFVYSTWDITLSFSDTGTGGTL